MAHRVQPDPTDSPLVVHDPIKHETAAHLLLLNLVCGIIWLLLTDKPGVSSFVTGFIIGFLIIYLFQPVLNAQNYIRRCFGLARFCVVFLKAFVASNLTIARSVLSEKGSDLKPSFIKYPVGHLRDGELVLLAHVITLTPGTTSVQISSDRGHLVVHAFHGAHPDEVVADIRSTLENAILRFTR
jgi:multicomponent Na+:H+ antiporter subunit E